MRLVAIPVVFLLGSFASRALLAHHPSSIAVDLAQPLPVATTWHAYGILTWVVLVATIAVAAIPYALVLRQDAPPVRTTVLVSAAAMIAGFFYTPLFSSDVYAYAAFGEMMRLGLDAYRLTLLPHGNALFDAAIWQWHNPLPLCVYGEAFVALSRMLIGLAAPFGVVAQLNILRITACVALAASIPLTYAALDGDPSRRRFAAAFVGLNPVAIWSAVEGHNDTIMLAIVLAGFALLRRRNGLLGACVVALGALVKVPALLAAGGLAINAIVKQKASVRTLSGLAAGIVLVALLSIPWAKGVQHGVLPHGVYEPLASPQGFIVSLARLAVPNDALAGIVASIIGITGIIILAVMGFRRLRDRGADAWCYFALAAWIAIPNPYPWYTVWIIPLGAVARDARLRAAILAVAFTSFMRYLPDAVDIPGPALNLALSAVTLLPYGFLIPPKRAKTGRRTYASSASSSSIKTEI